MKNLYLFVSNKEYLEVMKKVNDGDLTITMQIQYNNGYGFY